MSVIASLGRRLSNAPRPPRHDSRKEKTPIVIVFEFQAWRKTEEFFKWILEAATSSLIKNNDCCVVGQECRHFFFIVDEKPYYSRSWNDTYKHYTPRKLYVTKGCCLRVKGFSRNRQDCPFKSVAELQNFGENQIHPTTEERISGINFQ